MALSTQQQLNIASISEYLSYVAIQQGGLNGGGIPLDLPQKIYTIRKSIAYWYALDPTDTTLVATGNYLMALCGLYGLEAQEVTASGGTVAPSATSTAPLPLQFEVAASGTTFIDGQGSATLATFAGYNLLFSRNGIPQSTVSSQPSYYSWNRSTGLLTISPSAILGELFQIYPV